MRRYWHKQPLLVRNAIPAFSLAKAAKRPLDSPIQPESLFKMACDGKSESRLIQAQPWRFDTGPFSAKALPKLTDKNWTLLIQGVEVRHSAAAKVLSWFRFIPDARLDDLMISIAGVGGGVGPHFDSYDVFLIQMSGRRRWTISQQSDLSLNPKLPLKILSRFKPETSWDLEPGDLLYLPPHIAHEGIALDPACQTWSVGFRSPSFRELLQEGLWQLAETLEEDPHLENRYADPDQIASSDPSEFPSQMAKQVKALFLQSIQDKEKKGVNDFWEKAIAQYLSEPKPQAFFYPPKKMLSLALFLRQLESDALVIHPQTRILTQGKFIFCNGEEVSQDQSVTICNLWRQLGRQKRIKPNQSIRAKETNTLYGAYLAGWLRFEKDPKSSL
jgi:50S ribosomal protein L16 3-hydroxylase